MTFKEAFYRFKLPDGCSIKYDYPKVPESLEGYFFCELSRGNETCIMCFRKELIDKENIDQKSMVGAHLRLAMQDLAIPYKEDFNYLPEYLTK